MNSTLENNPYTLSILFNADGYLLQVFDESNNILSSKMTSCLFSSLTEDEIVKLLTHEAEVNASFKSLNLIYESSHYSLIPNSVFEVHEASHYLSFQGNTDKNFKILYTKIASRDVDVVFSIPMPLYLAIQTIFPSSVFDHQISNLLKNVANSSNNDSVYIWVRNKCMDVLVVKNKQLILVNSFDYVTAEDFAYYTLNLFEQLGLNTDTCEVSLLNAEKRKDYQILLQQYIRTVLCD